MLATDCTSKVDVKQHKENRAIENGFGIYSVCNKFDFPHCILSIRACCKSKQMLATDCSSKAEALQHKEKRAIENVVAIYSVCNAFKFPLLTLHTQHQSMLQKQANVGYRLQF